MGEGKPFLVAEFQRINIEVTELDHHRVLAATVVFQARIIIDAKTSG